VLEGFVDLNGVRLPITNMFDAEGEETELLEEARKIVVGPTTTGDFFGIDLTHKGSIN